MITLKITNNSTDGNAVSSKISIDHSDHVFQCEVSTLIDFVNGEGFKNQLNSALKEFCIERGFDQSKLIL